MFFTWDSLVILKDQSYLAMPMLPPSEFGCKSVINGNYTVTVNVLSRQTSCRVLGHAQSHI